MRVLLDTHTLILALLDPLRLGPDASSSLRARKSGFVVFAASVWELATKARIGKLPTATRIVDSYAEHLDRLGATELPVTSRQALLAGSMPWGHRDPFDRMLATQAIAEDLPLVTADTAFSGLAKLRLRW